MENSSVGKRRDFSFKGSRILLKKNDRSFTNLLRLRMNFDPLSNPLTKSSCKRSQSLFRQIAFLKKAIDFRIEVNREAPISPA
ncbi:hypothetical protein DLM77_15595 [Leptospira yasudae]|uniref:Uncharacterized protein n=1 Tax=Leptospira yasudae TaxID=2202201 RepID=A0ABX9LZT5_9LEPT|nr:hypothetical protein DLM77_15595 [Leptospira yasudae]